MPYRKPKETIDLTGWLAPWEADVYRRRIDDLLDLLSRIRKVVHDALPDKTDPLELDAAIEAVLRENAELRADAELAEAVIVEDDAELLRLRLAQLDLRAENAQLRAMLLELEWLPSDRMEPLRFPNLKYCPICQMPNHHGHADGCRLAAVLSTQ